MCGRNAIGMHKINFFFQKFFSILKAPLGLLSSILFFKKNTIDFLRFDA